MFPYKININHIELESALPRLKMLRKESKLSYFYKFGYYL